MEKRKPIISTVTPCYNEEAAIPLFYQELCRVAEEMADAEFEFLFVDDGSKDGTLEILRELNQRDARVHYVSFSRNFWKEAGIYAGLQNVSGDFVAILDADMQILPHCSRKCHGLCRMRNMIVVGTRRVTQQRGAACAFYVCPYILPANEPDFKNRSSRWGKGFSTDEPQSGGCGPFGGGIQPVFQRNFRLGGF